MSISAAASTPCTGKVFEDEMFHQRGDLAFPRDHGASTAGLVPVVMVKIKGVRDVLTDLEKQGITSPGEVASCNHDELVNLNREEHDKCLSRKHGGNCGGGSRVRFRQGSCCGAVRR